MEKKFIQSIYRALEILEFIGENGNKCRVLDIANGIGLKSTTVHSIIKTLENKGYLIRDDKSPKYSLGLNCMRLGIIYRRDFFAREKMHNFLIKLSEKIGETSFFLVRVGHQFFYLDAVAPDKSIKADAQIGIFKNLELNCAISRVFLSQDQTVNFEIELEENEDGINSLAIPFKDKDRLIGVIAFKGPAYRFKNSTILEAYQLYNKILSESIE